MRMHMRIATLFAVLLLAGPASAATLTLTDGGDGLPYGDTSGFVVDFDATYAWSPSLVAGQTYSIESISIWEASDSAATPNNTPVYLSVFDSTFAGFTGDTSGSHLGFSDNAIDHTATPDTSKITYTFTGITVTADNDGALGGSGLVYFTWDDNTTRNNFGTSGGVHPYQRIDSNPPAADYGAAVFAFGAIQTSRVPEIEITVRPVPEPSTLALFGLSSLGVLATRRRKPQG
ncbi:MAG: PEP-CTERM sorting domain-containing protein [Planctomycetales bacterium]|nr:PEP-CTERM sorting domain-containing protein [Planctomycetales bacterium]